MLKMICLTMLRVYQRFISPLKPPVCRYHPSCSQYAFLQFEKKNLLIAFCLSFLRILRCNPYFEGGFDYPKISKKFKSYNFCFKPIFLAQKKLCYLYIPCAHQNFYILKINFKKER